MPSFNIVLAADYAPVSGMHGIFISDDEVMSIVLPSDAGTQVPWQVLKKKAYSTQEELIEYVTLLSAGFKLP